MNYRMTQLQLDNWNRLINQGGAGTTSKVSDALAALEPNVKPEGKPAFNDAVKYNKQNADIYIKMQQLHDEVAKQTISDGGSGQPDTGIPPDPGPSYPPGTPVVDPVPGVNGGMNLGTFKVNGGPEGPDHPGTTQIGFQAFKGKWYYGQADGDADTATMSSDGGYVAISVTDQPSDPTPATWSYANSAEIRPIKKGQYFNIAVGEGGYYSYRAALAGIIKYAG